MDHTSARRFSRVLRTAAATGVVAVWSAAPAAAQDETALKTFFEGQRVVLKLDMPGTSDGVDVRMDARQPIDFGRYRDRLKSYGVAIHAGEAAVVTLIKYKDDHIEFQLGGGGYGTFGDDTSTSVYMPLVEKSSRERELERRIDDEQDRRKRRDMQRELDELRDHRERENARITAEREAAEAHKARLIAERRLHAGSRFNLRYDDRVPRGLRPDEVMAALSAYVDFPGAAPGPEAMLPPPPDQRVDLRKGMSRAEVEDALGPPSEASERREGGMAVTTLVFVRDGERVTADFVEGVLIRYSIASRD